MSRTRVEEKTVGLATADRRALSVLSWLAAFAAIVTVALLGVTIADTLTSSTVTVYDASAGSADPLPALTEMSGGPVTAVPANVDVTVDEAPASVRLPLAASAVTGALTPLGIAVVLFFLGRQIARERIRRAVGFGAVALSLITFASALFTPFLHAIAGTEALRLGPLGDSAPFQFTLSADLLALPALLLLLGALLLVSERWQRDTEGLV